MNENMFRLTVQPHFEKSSLIVGWNRDSGRLNTSVIDYLTKKIRNEPFCDIEPAGFFPLAGVSVQNNVAHFPESRFYYNQEKNLVLFKADEPQFEKYQFLNAVLDVAEQYCRVKHLYTVNGAMSLAAHTSERRILAVFNQAEFREELRGYELNNMTWQGPPAMSSYLLWLAARRGLAGMSLWTQIPFYLAAWQDWEAIKTTVSFLDRRLNLEMDLKELNEQSDNQNNSLARLRKEDPEINKCVGALEGGLSLSDEEQMRLIKEVGDFFEKKG